MFWSSWRKFWFLWRRDGKLLWRSFFHPARPKWLRLALLALLAYIVMPFDVLPDWIPFLGQLDDVLILSWGARALLRALPPALVLDLERKPS